MSTKTDVAVLRYSRAMPWQTRQAVLVCSLVTFAFAPACGGDDNASGGSAANDAGSNDGSAGGHDATTGDASENDASASETGPPDAGAADASTGFALTS